MAIPRMLFASAIGPWHKWYAWKPVKTYDGRIVWLDEVWRQGCQSNPHLDGPTISFFQYSIEDPR